MKRIKILSVLLVILASLPAFAIPPMSASRMRSSMGPASALNPGYLTPDYFNTFDRKLDASRVNYMPNPGAEESTDDWTPYNDAGRTDAAYVVEQDLTFTAVASGNSGNGININYVFHGSQSSSTPLVTVVSPTQVTVAWYNGPTIANNPTATQLKTAWDANVDAVALATVAITGTASNRQYITGSNLTANGGDVSPVDGNGGSVDPGVTFTRNTSSPLQGAGDFDLGKDAASRQGHGVSSDFQIDSLDKGNYLQVSFSYTGSSGITLGSSSDVRVFIYDITNAELIPFESASTLAGPVSTTKVFTGKFLAAEDSVNYRIIVHIATTSATAWDLRLDNVVVNNILNAETATNVPAVVLPLEPVSVAVTDHMAVAWIDGASQWVPATNVFNGDQWGHFGFATNISGGFADITIDGELDGFSFGPFAGYNQYVSTTPGQLTPIYPPANTYLIMGKGISATKIFVRPYIGFANVPTKGGILVGTGTAGDAVLPAGSNGAVPFYNSGVANGISTGAAVVAAAPFTYTLSTRTLTIATSTNSVAGVLSAADHTTYSGYAATIALKAPLASPTFTGDVDSSTGNVKISTIGKGLQIKTGSNAKVGSATLVGGTVTVSNTSVTANSAIFLTRSAAAGLLGELSYTVVAATSFTITSASATETSTIKWHIIESIP